MVRDAEGHTKVVTIAVDGAADGEDDAERATRKLAGSLLVKSSFSWLGSVLGTGAVRTRRRRLSRWTPRIVSFSPTTTSSCRRALAPTGADASGMAGQPELALSCRLGRGSHRFHVITNDLTHAYIDENMGTS